MEPLIHLTIFLLTIIILAKVSASLSGRLRLPSITLQLLTGIALGPSLLNLLGSPLILGTLGSVSPSPLHGGLKIFAEIGLIQLMFFAGMETNWAELGKLTRGIFNVGAWGFVLTAGATVMVTRLFADRWAEAMAMGAVMAASSFGISVYNLSEMKLSGSKASTLSAGSAIVSGLLAMLLMIVSLTTNYAASFGGFKAIVAVSWFLGKLVMFFAVAYFLTSRFLKLATKTGIKKRPRQMLIGYLLLVAAIYAWAAMHFGSFAAIGVASLRGALLSRSPFEIKERIVKGLGAGPASLFIGVLFIALGMEINLKEVWGQLFFLAVLLTTVVASKLFGCWIASRKTSESTYERVFVMFATLPQGEVGMVIAAYLFSRGLVNPVQFNVAITSVVLLTMIAPVLIKRSLRDSSPATLSSLSPSEKGERILSKKF